MSFRIKGQIKDTQHLFDNIRFTRYFCNVFRIINVARFRILAQHQVDR